MASIIKGLSRYVVGAIFILIGILCLRDPGVTLASVAIYLGVGFVIHGVTSLYAYFQGGETSRHGGWRVVEGILSLIVGVMFLMNLGTGSAAATMMMLIWLTVGGVFRLTAGYHMKRAGLAGWWVPLASGLILLVCAFFLAFHPVLAMLTLTTLVAWIFIFYGVVIILEGFSLHG